MLCLFDVVLWVGFLVEVGFASGHAFRGTSVAKQTAQDGRWWQTDAMYEIFVRSFQDSDGDGTGDLKGIEQRLPYLKELGVGFLWISPVMTSPMRDAGYDITDFTQIDPLFGTMSDMRNLITAAKKLGIRILMDFVPNHTSNESAWFASSRSSKMAPKRDWYVWHPGKKLPDGTRAPPNNWNCNLGSSWTWDENTQEYYYHAFGDFQPDLNYRNPEVVAAMEEVLRFWMRLGVAGFRVDAVNNLLEDAALRDEPVDQCEEPEGALAEWRCQTHCYTRALEENHAIYKGWRKTIDEFDNGAIFAEQYDDIDTAITYYGTETEPEFNFPFNMQMVGDAKLSNATVVSDKIRNYSKALPKWCHGNWVLGNHDMTRFTSVLSNNSAMSATVWAFFNLLPGTPTIYNGDEIAMQDLWVPHDRIQDHNCLLTPNRFDHDCRDPARTPMQWDSGPQAGFSSNPNTWLPINPNYVTKNIESQTSDPMSPLSIMKRVLSFRSANKEIALGRITHVATDLTADVRDHIISVQYSTECSWALTIANWNTAKAATLNPRMLLSAEMKADPLSILQIRFSTMINSRPKRFVDSHNFVLEKGEVVVLTPDSSACKLDTAIFM